MQYKLFVCGADGSLILLYLSVDTMAKAIKNISEHKIGEVKFSIELVEEEVIENEDGKSL